MVETIVVKEIKAEPEVVWTAVADITLMGGPLDRCRSRNVR